MKRRFAMVDVFSSVPFGGNPLAVVIDAEGMSTEQMQTVTRWMNLSETAFLVPPTDKGADYRVRIFTLTKELPFAGHPTLGACHTWLATGGTPRHPEQAVQECGAAWSRSARPGDRLAFAAPPLLRSGPVDAAFLDELTVVLGIDAGDIVDSRWIDNGPGWVGIPLKDAETVLAVDADFSRYTGPGPLDIGLIGPHPDGSDAAFEIRALFSDDTGAMREDPVTGSLNAAAGQWLFATGRASSPYHARQGTRLGRNGQVHVEQETDSHVWIGGATITRVEGTLHS